MFRVILHCGLGFAEDLGLLLNSATERRHMASLCLSFPIPKTRMAGVLAFVKALYTVMISCYGLLWLSLEGP